MSLIKLGDAVVAGDRVLAIHPQGSPVNVIEVLFDNGEKLIMRDPDPRATVKAYFGFTVGPTAKCST
jgi:hypothetical protein